MRPSDPNEPDADFFRINAWGQSADYMSNYATKGRMVELSGRIESRKFTDKDGNEREVWEVTAESVSLIDKAPDGEGGQGSGQRSTAGNQQGGYGGGQGQRQAPQGGGGRTATAARPSADEYDPFADE